MNNIFFMKTCFTAEMKGLQAASYERTDYYGDNDRGDFHSHERFRDRYRAYERAGIHGCDFQNIPFEERRKKI